MWWESQVLWAGVASVITALLGGVAAIVVGKRQQKPTVAHANLPAAIEDLDGRFDTIDGKADGIASMLSRHIADINKDVTRIHGDLVVRLDELDDKATSNARALSELRGMLTMLASSR